MARLKQISIDTEINAVIEGARRSFSETENDILRRLLLPSPTLPKSHGVDREASTADCSAALSARRRGNWTVEFLGDRLPAANLKDAYQQTLLLLARMDRSFLEDFSKEGSRSRRYVARQPEALYETAPHLARAHAKPLIDGWFFDSNLSTDQVGKRLRVAARLAHIPYGPKLRVLDGLREI